MTKIQQIKHQKSMEYWKQVVMAQQQSGLSVTEYCRKQDIKYNAFYYWLRKIREQFVDGMPELPAIDSSETQFAVLSTTSVTAAVPMSERRSRLKLSVGVAVLEVTEDTSRELLLKTLSCIKEVFPAC